MSTIIVPLENIFLNFINYQYVAIILKINSKII